MRVVQVCVVRAGLFRPQWLLSLVLAAVLLSLPQTAAAQTIAGVVRDTSGSVLPGVSVEASSSALIEKVRTVVSDGDGQYRFENLVPFLVGLNSARQKAGTHGSGTSTKR